LKKKIEIQVQKLDRRRKNDELNGYDEDDE
jgi:hypothetical protein